MTRTDGLVAGGTRSQPATPGRGLRRVLGSFDWTGVAFMVPILVMVIAMVVVPVAHTVYYSLTAYAGLGSPHWIGFANYRELFDDPEFRRIIENNLLLVLGLFAWVTIPFLLAALIYGRKRADLLRTILFVPVLLPPVVVGLVFEIMFAPSGPINAALRAIGLGAFALGWLTDPNVVLITAVIVITWAVMGTGVLFYSAGLAGIPRERIEAAQVDGAEWRHVVWNVYRPALAKVMRFFVLLLTVTTVTGFFPWIFGLTQGGPGISSTTLDYFVYQDGIVSGDFGKASAIAVCSIVLLCLILGVMTGASILAGRSRRGIVATGAPRALRTAGWHARARIPKFSFFGMRARRATANWLRTGTLVATVISVIIPLLWVIRLSFRPVSQWIQNQSAIGGSWTFANFANVWTSAHLGHNLLNSFIVVPLGAVLATVLAAISGFALAKLRVPARKPVLAAIGLAVFVPLPAIAIPEFNQALSLGYVNSLPGVSLVYGGLFASWGTLLMYAYFRDLHEDLMDSARVDGATPFQTFRRIALPLAKPAVAAVFVINMLVQWNELIVALVMLPDQAKQTVTVAIASLSTQYFAYGPYTAAGVLIAALPIMIIYAVGQRFIRADLLSGAVKG